MVFGKESVGLSKEVLAQFENHLTIPMSNLISSFNIANSVAFVVGEAKRQISVLDRSIYLIKCFMNENVSVDDALKKGFWVCEIANVFDFYTGNWT